MRMHISGGQIVMRKMMTEIRVVPLGFQDAYLFGFSH